MPRTATAPNITRYRTTRGRPRQTDRPTGVDCGTPELVLKRAMGLTAEAVDLCLERCILTPEQHWCALHFRWLYAVRYGVPGVTALDISRGHGRECYAEENDHWRLCRERDYHRGLKRLTRERATDVITRFCVYNDPPRALNRTLLERAYTDAKLRAAIEQELFLIRSGLDALVELWGRVAIGK